MQKEKMKVDFQQKISAVSAINERLGEISGRIEYSTVFAAYMLYKVSVDGGDFPESREASELFLASMNKIVKGAVCDMIPKNAWNDLETLIDDYTSEIYRAIIFMPISNVGIERSNETPDSIIRLSRKILQCREGENIADIGCGTGNFLLAESAAVPGAHYQGYEINPMDAAVSLIRAEILGGDVQIHLQDAFAIPNNQNMKFDKIFANYPFGLQLRNLSGGAQYLEQMKKKLPTISRATSSDWVFNMLLMDIMKGDGKAIGIMTNGSTWNSIDIPMRKHFVENGLVECVIALPGRMFSNTGIQTSLIVLSHGNHSVRLVDATELYDAGRRQNEFSDKHIAEIVEAMNTDSEYSKKVTFEELAASEYSLNLNRYCQPAVHMKHGVPFETVAQRITRGASCTARQLDEMVSIDETPQQYLMLANIQHGMIDADLPYLATLDPKYEKYCLEDKNLILSKNGNPYKVAVAEVKPGQKILANGNLYVIHLDLKKVNPYYLKAFFESEKGKAALQSITVGTAIPNIGVDKLRKLMIPLPPMEEQEKIAQEYQAAQDEIRMLKTKLDRAVNRMHHVFDEESEALYVEQ